MLDLKNIHKSFGKIQVLKDVSLHFGNSEVVALLGPNGSGKTTLLKIILGLTIAQNGEVKVAGKEITHDHSYRNIIGYMPQIARYPENLTVGELFKLLRGIRNNPTGTDEELYDRLLIHALMDKSLGSLSGGQKQKIGAYAAFLFNPEIVILDEPTAGLDPVSTEIVKSKILSAKQKRKLVIITTHIMQDADELCDRLIYLIDGKIFLDANIPELKQVSGENILNKALAKNLSAV